MTNAPLGARVPVDRARATHPWSVAAAMASACLLLLGIGSVAAAAMAHPDDAVAPAMAGALSLPVGGSLAAWTLLARTRLHGAHERVRSALAHRPGAGASCPDPVRGDDRVDGLLDVVGRFYSTCSGSAFERRWSEFANLFEPGARLVQVDRDGRASGAELTVPEFIALARTSVHESRFGERRRVVHVLGAFAGVLSEFDAVDRGVPGEFQGVNCIELHERDGTWRIGRVLCAAVASLNASAAEVS